MDPGTRQPRFTVYQTKAGRDSSTIKNEARASFCSGLEGVAHFAAGAVKHHRRQKRDVRVRHTATASR